MTLWAQSRVVGRHHEHHCSNSKKGPWVTTLKQVVHHSTDDINLCLEHCAIRDTRSVGAASVKLELRRNMESEMELSMSWSY